MGGATFWTLFLFVAPDCLLGAVDLLPLGSPFAAAGR